MSYYSLWIKWRILLCPRRDDYLEFGDECLEAAETRNMGSSEEAGVDSIWKFAFLVALVEIEITPSCQNVCPTLAVDS